MITGNGWSGHITYSGVQLLHYFYACASVAHARGGGEGLNGHGMDGNEGRGKWKAVVHEISSTNPLCLGHLVIETVEEIMYTGVQLLL